jgi:hypothetical protein
MQLLEILIELSSVFRQSHNRHCGCDLAIKMDNAPGVPLGVADRVWAIGDLLDATLALEPNCSIRTVRNFTVIDGGKE